MGAIVGDYAGGGPSTWGALRSIIINGTLSGSPIANGGDHNVEYDHGFKTAAGNGFIRTDYSALYFNASAKASGPNFIASGVTSSPALSRFGSYYSINGAGSASGMLVNEDRSQLTGETVTVTSGTFTIGSSAFVGPSYQTYSTYNASEVITAIGKLTAF